MLCAGRLLAEGTFESHQVHEVFTGGIHIPSFLGGVQTPLTTVLGGSQAGGGGGVHVPLTRVFGGLQLEGGGGGVPVPVPDMATDFESELRRRLRPE